MGSPARGESRPGAPLPPMPPAIAPAVRATLLFSERAKWADGSRRLALVAFMSERTPCHHRIPLAVALAPLAALSGCLTGELWGDYAWPEPEVTERRIARHTELGVGTLVESQPAVSYTHLRAHETPEHL